MDVSLRFKDTFNILINPKTSLFLLILILFITQNTSFGINNSPSINISKQYSFNNLNNNLSYDVLSENRKEILLKTNFDENESILAGCGCGLWGCDITTCTDVNYCGGRRTTCAERGCGGTGCGCGQLCYSFSFRKCGNLYPCDCEGYNCNCNLMCERTSCSQSNKCGGDPCTCSPKPCFYSTSKPCSGKGGTCTCDDECYCPQKCDNSTSYKCEGSTVNCASAQGCNGSHCGQGGSEYCDGTFCYYYPMCPKYKCGANK